MDQNSNTISDARTPPPEVVKLNERITELEEREYALMMENYRLKTTRRRLKKSFNRLARRFLLMKEKYTAVKDERDRLAQDEYWVSAAVFLFLLFCLFLLGLEAPPNVTHISISNEMYWVSSFLLCFRVRCLFYLSVYFYLFYFKFQLVAMRKGNLCRNRKPSCPQNIKQNKKTIKYS